MLTQKQILQHLLLGGRVYHMSENYVYKIGDYGSIVKAPYSPLWQLWTITEESFSKTQYFMLLKANE